MARLPTRKHVTPIARVQAKAAADSHDLLINGISFELLRKKGMIAAHEVGAASPLPRRGTASQTCCLSQAEVLDQQASEMGARMFKTKGREGIDAATGRISTNADGSTGSSKSGNFYSSPGSKGLTSAAAAAALFDEDDDAEIAQQVRRKRTGP